MKKKKIHRKIVAFSGGYDSSLMLAKLTKELSKIAPSEREYEIVPLSIVHHMTGDPKLEREKECRKNIMDYLAENYPNVDMTNIEMECSAVWDLGGGENNKGLAQPILWLCNLIPIIRDGDEVYLGYINGDQAWVHIDSIHQLWEAGLAIQENKKVELRTPNKYMEKTDIIECMINEFPGLIKRCTSCESLMSGSGVCGDCLPCKHLKRALINLIISGSPSVSEICSEILNEYFHIEIQVTDHRYEINSSKVADTCDETATEVITLDTKERVN